MESHRSVVRKLASATLACVFFFDGTLFAQVRAVAAAQPPIAALGRTPVQSPYVLRSEQELIASIVERAEALSTAPFPAASSTTEPTATPSPAPATGLPAIPPPRHGSLPLGNWSQEGEPARGAWELAPSGYEVTEQLAEGPTFFVSPDDHIDTTVTGKLRVGPHAAEDGLLGFVFGYRAPLASQSHDEQSADFVLLDWSGRDRAPEEGFTLARVRGLVTDPHTVYRLRAPEAVVEVLASDYGDGKGWQKSRWYPFEISYRGGRLRVRIDGRDVFDVTRPFVSGRMGFYTYGQADVTFADIDVEHVNQPPVALIGGERFFEVGFGCSATVALDGSASSDPDGDPLHYLWSGPFGTLTGVLAEASLPPGTHTVGLEVSDAAGRRSTTSVELTVSETGNLPGCSNTAAAHPASPTSRLEAAGPSVAVTVDTKELWPPNHELVDVGLTVIATDPSRLRPSVSLTVWSNEPELAPGSGNHAPDAELDEGALFLRSERSGPGDGRVYLILATAEGPSGLEEHACTAVVVPHSMSPAERAAVEEQAQLAVEACEATGAPPDGYVLLEEGPYPATPPFQSLVPKLLCVVPNERAFFGYENENPVPVYVDVSSQNRLAPPPDDRGQPTAFLPGAVEAAFGVPFDGSDVSWRLTGPDGVERAATASGEVPECDVVPSLPDARDDEATTDAETPVTLDVLANDVDPENDPLRLARFTAPANGTLTLEPDDRVTYTPAVGFAGTDAFSYTITDGIGWDQATVVVTVVGGEVNEPPVVDAGDDVAIQLPETTATLDGTVIDDGLPAGTLHVLWTQVSGPTSVVFTDPASASTTASFPVEGAYVLRLTADDSELSAFDEVTVTVLPLPVISISIGDVSVLENEGEALVPVTLSSPAPASILVDFLTFDGTALAGCDYLTRYGTLELAAGASGGTITVPLVDELEIEADETFFVRLGNPLGVELGDDQATVTIRNDDASNRAPAPPHDRVPADGATGLAPSPTLSWQSSDPENDPLAFDVFFGTAFSTDGQSWTRSCPAGPSPEPRAFGASVLDEANDRLTLFGGATASGETSEVWVLENATGARGAPAWTELVPASGPSPSPRQRTAYAYDASANRLLVSGGCTSDCTVPLADTWVLTNANGLGGTPQWLALPDAPSAHAGAAFAYDRASERLFVVAEDEVLVLDTLGGASGTWSVLPATGDVPSPRSLALAAYDARTDAILLVGGRLDGDVATSDVYKLSLAPSAVWTKLSPTGALPARYAHAGFYGPASGRLIVFGGSSSGLDSGANLVAGDVWMLENAFGVNPAWRMLSPANAPVPARLGAQAAYSSFENRFVVVSGLNNRSESRLDDVLVLNDAVGSLPLISADQTSTSFPSATPDVSRTYFWRVTAKDTKGARAGAPVFRFRPNAEPTVDAGADLEIRLPEVAVLDATATDDGLEGSLTFLWEAVDGPAAVSFGDETAEDTTASFSVEGVYTLRVTVSDGAFEASDTLVATVLEENQPPRVAAGDDRSLTFPDASLTFTAVVTDDYVPGALSFTWSLVSGPAPVAFGSPDAVSTSATFTTRGTYLLRLSVSDGELTGFDDVVVEVIQPNAPPVVDAGSDQAAAAVTDTVTLSGSVTDDGLPSGALTIGWSLAAGPGSVTFGDPTSPGTTASFDIPGAYVLRLTADDSALSAFDEVTVTIGDPAVLADLTVDSVDTSALFVDPQTLEMSGAVAAVVSNVGGGPAIGPLEIVFFEDRNQNRSFDPLGDNVLGATELLALDDGASASVFASLLPGNAMLFSGNLVFAFVDAGGVVPESDETNNLGSSVARCDFTPLPSSWNPTLEWSWTSSSARPESVQVLMTPVVLDLDGDGISDVVFTSYEGNNSTANGVLRALSGRDGSELFTVTDPALALEPTSQIAAGDIDGDGRPEIVAVHQNDHLIAFEHDGTRKWEGPDLDGTAGWGAPALAQLNGAGLPEIVFGREVFDATDGSLVWRGTAGRGSLKGPLSLVADVDLDGAPEIVAGNTVYEADGAIFWQNTSLPDGVNAIGNFDADPFPEIVLVAQAQIWLLEHDGTVKWGPTPFPFHPVTGGPPVIADFDGDGEPEIGVPDFDRYYLFETDGTVKWQVPIVENSAGNGSSAFDFEGDGAAELVYADTQTLRIHRGTDGALLFQTDVGNVTAYEAAIVADVDSDGDAEIVAVANKGAGGERSGVFVFEDANDHWALARAIWNQYSYHVTNVNDDGTIPDVEANSWQSFNSYRANVFVGVNGSETSLGCQFAKPDLTASFLRKTAGVSEVSLTARIGNGGAAVVGPGVPVSLYDGEPLRNRKLATVRTTAYLDPGEFEDVSFVVASSLVTESSLWVVADDFGGLKGTVTESDETNNAVDSGLALVGNAGPGSGEDPDLVATRVDVSGVTVEGQTLQASGTVVAEVRNQGRAT